MGSSSNLVVPVVMWGRHAPTHCISSILMTQNEQNIVTGCNDGQLCVWDVEPNGKIIPRSLLLGHSAAITCLTKGSNHPDRAYIISSAENGEMCLWDIRDGRCVEYNRMSCVHTSVQAYHMINTRDIRLVCNGHYSEIHVIDPISLEILFSLTSKVQSNWISALCIIRPVNRHDDVVVAITNSGAVKCWTLSGSELKSKYIMEDESKQIRCLNAHTLRCCAFNQRTVFIACSKYWQIYDLGDFSLLCSESAPRGERWKGGDFIAIDRVVVWSNHGKGYLYKLPTNANPRSGEYRNQVGAGRNQSTTPYAYSVLLASVDKAVTCAPAMNYFFGTREQHKRILLRGDPDGKIVMWNIPSMENQKLKLTRQESFDRLPSLSPSTTCALQDAWDTVAKVPDGILDVYKCQQLRITSTCYIPSQGKLVCGRSDGTIVIVPATQSIVLLLLSCGDIKSDESPNHLQLSGHSGKVTYVLYPFNDSTRYEPQHLVSGGIDFAVILWDIFTGNKLHQFMIQGGEITRLLVPPDNCNNRVLTSICSVASDHSVALISLRERKCILLAARQLFPVQTIKWRPLDDYLVVGCTDGSVYVWQMETGALDRVVHGITAVEVLHACDQAVTAPVMETEALTNPHISISQALKRRNIATFRTLAVQRLQQQGLNKDSPNQIGTTKPQAFPMTIQGIRTNSHDPDSHVILFDTEGLIVQLLSDEFASMSPGTIEAHGLMAHTNHEQRKPSLTASHPGLEHRSSQPSSPDPQRKLAEFITKVKDKAEDVQKKIQHEIAGKRSENQKKFKKQDSKKKSRSPDSNLTMEIAQLFMSCLHAWGLDPDLDKLCFTKLGLLKPRCPISFGLVSRGDHMSLLLPGWQSRPVPKADTPDLINFEDTGRKVVVENGTMEDMVEKWCSRGHWLISSAVTTQHLLSVISTANTLMSMTRCSFKHIKPTNMSRWEVDQDDSSSDTDSVDEFNGLSLTPSQAQIKQGWSLLAALHCVLLPDFVSDGAYQPPLLEMLARRWQHRCLEIREAAQALLLAELRRIGPDGRKTLVDLWSPYLPSYVDPNISILSESPRSQTQSATDQDDDDEDDDHMMQDTPYHNSTTFESRRRQATAIVMLGVIGAEFGQEMEPSRRRSSVQPVESTGKVQDGFGLKNYSLARHTSKALTFLLLTPPSVKLPAFTPIRRAAVDLIGRGFTVWEPYMDVSAVLLGLLELCVDGDKLVPSMTFGLPLTPAADACRTARHALSLIATARSPAFIITMAKEVARHNALAQNSQHQHQQLIQSVLVRARPEILRVFEILMEKMPNDVVDLMVETMDVIVHCLDPGAVKVKGLVETFPAISRFHQITYCPSSRRICVGAKNGGLAFYELKQSKCQIIAGHSGAVTCVTFSPDGKFVASYSLVDNKLMFWQTASSGILSLGQTQTKCVKVISTPPCNMTAASNPLKLARVAWLDNRTAVLWTADGTENKYRV